jgi:MraZ protein
VLILHKFALTVHSGRLTIAVDFSGQKWSLNVLRGNYPAKIDDKGRLKLPASFRALVHDTHGTGLYVTSITGESVRIYPMPVWLALEQRLAKMPSTHPARLKFLARVSYYGQHVEFDIQGRVMIPWQLRDVAAMTGDVDVLGQIDYLDVWSHERFVRKMAAEPFTDDDAKALAEFEI